MNFFNIGPMELLLILTVVLIVFGPDKIPDIAGSIGKSLRQFRQASKEISEEFDLEDLSPETIADALEAKAVADEKAEKGDKGEAESPPALPASVASSAAEEPEEGSDVDEEAGEKKASRQRFHLPPAVKDTPAVTDTPAVKDTSVEDADEDAGGEDAPRQRFHLPPAVKDTPAAKDTTAGQKPPAEDAVATPDAESLTIDYESPEDAH